MASPWLWCGVVRSFSPWVFEFVLILLLLCSQGILGWRFFLFVAREEDDLVVFPLVWCGEGLPCYRETLVGYRLVGPATPWVSRCGGFGVWLIRLVPITLLRFSHRGLS